MVQMLRSCACIVFLVLSLVVVPGCSSGNARYGVSGTITFKNNPIKDGQVLFIPEGGHAPAGGGAIKNGKYEIQAANGLAAGKYLVSVSEVISKVNAKELEMPGVSGDVKELIPAKYNQNTELRAEVTSSGKNEFNFTLK